MKAKYRIVRDDWSGYEVQSWRWWWPFWIQGRTNTHPTLERAEAYAREVANGRSIRDLGYL